jgi:hypothetical protein
MQTGLIRILIPVLTGAVLALLLVKSCTKNPEVVTIQTTIIKVDTVFIEKNPKPIYVLPKLAIDTVRVYDSLRFYSGRHTFKYGYFDYKIKTAGYLDYLEFSPSLTIPETTITRTIMQTKPRFYGTISGGEHIAALGLIHVREKMIYGYRYNLATNSHDFTLGIRLY